jgi:hypothetical protein
MAAVKDREQQMAGGDPGLPLTVGDSQGVLGDQAPNQLGEGRCRLMKWVRTYPSRQLDHLADGAKLTIGPHL